MKKYILLIIIFLVAITIYIGFKKINIGALTLKILERSAHIKVDYTEITGNIFSGFRITDYKVLISKNDSIYGTYADIKYQFNPFDFRFPNFFQISLIEPTISIQKKKSTKLSKPFTPLELHLGLRINVKNGRLIYKEKKTHTIKNISGLIFIDFVGPKIFLSTMNLSFQYPDYHIVINSTNINAIINHKGVLAKLIKLKGRGINIEAEADYQLAEQRLLIKFKKAKVDLKQLSLHKGRIDFSGVFGLQDGKPIAKLHGDIKGFSPFERFRFETTSSSDTILLNIFDGRILKGTLFAQARVLNLKKLEFETNFRDVDLAEYINAKTPILISGYLSYRNRRYTAFLNSPREKGFGIDSLFAFGTVKGSRIKIDSIYTIEGKKTLRINGEVVREEKFPFNLSLQFHDFRLDRFSEYLPIRGLLKGTASIQGEFSKINDFSITANIKGKEFGYDTLNIKNFYIKFNNFQVNKKEKRAEIYLKNIVYKRFNIQRLGLRINNRQFTIRMRQDSDSVIVKGELDDQLAGRIDVLLATYNGIQTTNRAPIQFDIPAHKIDELHLKFIDGDMRISISPLSIQLRHGNLDKLAQLCKLEEKLEGILEFKFKDTNFNIRAEKVNFRGLKDALLSAAGYYQHEKTYLYLDSLSITDASNQRLYIHGFIRKQNSDLKLEMKNLRAGHLQFLQKFLDNPAGLINGRLHFQGDLEKFALSGELLVKQASFGLPVIASRFDSVSGKIIFKGKKLIFRDVQALVTSTRVGSSLPTAPVYAGGVVKLEQKFKVRNFKYDLSFKDAPVQYLPFAFGVGSGNFSIGMDNGIMFYNGNITLKEAIVPIDFGTRFSSNTTKTGNNNWRMNLRLKADRNIWLRNKSADIEFGGELYLIKDKGPLSISGNLKSQRGTFYWLNHTLTVTRGNITFIPQEIIDPELDVWARMNTRGGIKIILHFFGPVSEPIFEFFTDPPGRYSEQDILTYLNLNITWEELDKIKQGEYVGKILPGSIVSWLESDVSRRIRKYTGFDYFRIETPLFEADEKTRVTVGKYISRNLFITYTYDLTSFSNEFNVEYFLDDKNEILIKKDETGEYSLQYQYRIRF